MLCETMLAELKVQCGSDFKREAIRAYRLIFKDDTSEDIEQFLGADFFVPADYRVDITHYFDFDNIRRKLKEFKHRDVLMMPYINTENLDQRQNLLNLIVSRTKEIASRINVQNLFIILTSVAPRGHQPETALKRVNQ